MNDKSQKAKQKGQIRTKNVLEAINEIGSQVVDTAKNEVKATSDEFFRQLLGQQKKLQEKRSGDLSAGRSLDMGDVISGREEQKKKYDEQLFFERRLFNEEKQETSKKLQELRLRLQAIQSEAAKLVNSTRNLAEEVKTAVLLGTVDASEYQINVYESIINMVSNFRKKIDSAVVWLQGTNKRAEKKNFWSQYKKKGSSFLLSGETYSQRSAG